MKRKRTRKGTRVGDLFEVLKHTLDGAPCAIYLCRGCSRAWRLPDPAETWRVNTLLSHAAAHATDATVKRQIENAAPDRAEG